MKIIGLGHYSRTGKDTVANRLIETLTQQGIKAKKISFAWKLKQIAHELYGWAGLREPSYYETDQGEIDRGKRLYKMASERYPNGPTAVEIWIDLGTPAIRNNVYANTWVDYVLKTDHGVDVLVVPDCRFINEVAAIKELGGTMIKVVRPGYKPRNSPADMNLFLYRGWDGIIGTSGTMDELRHEGDRIAFAIRDNQPLTFHPLKTNKGYQMEQESGVPQSWIDQYSEPWDEDILHAINRLY